MKMISQRIIEENGLNPTIAIATSEYHEYRAGKIAESLVHHKLSNLMFNLPDCIICGVVVNRRSHRYASFLRLAYETIILR